MQIPLKKKAPFDPISEFLFHDLPNTVLPSLSSHVHPCPSKEKKKTLDEVSAINFCT
jgi:hypothetical protein